MAQNDKFYNKKELAAKYSMNRKTFAKILERHKIEIGEPIGYFFTPNQIEKIKNILGDFE